ncbi:hypothetical protein F5Y18DRAFT_433899 [Xylariaceae sp. FL1019]|nr:hypothetical protein F5Y18DRAFT_433899 [Xylariaceae sp. FL1019]
MCEVILFICAEHDNIRKFSLIRCDKAVQDSGLSKYSPDNFVNKMPRLRAEQGCDDVPKIVPKIQTIDGACPPSVWDAKMNLVLVALRSHCGRHNKRLEKMRDCEMGFLP